MIRVGIIDSGMGNINSIKKAVERSGGVPIVINTEQEMASADKIILPGVGSFFEGVENLKKLNLMEPLQDISSDNKPLLGICLGMQLLGTLGEEGGVNRGLNLIEGITKRLHPQDNSERIPHVGWNEVKIIKNNSLFYDIPDNSDFYFVHSYYFLPDNSDFIDGMTSYCRTFTSVIHNKNVFGVQFHPEKSGQLGSKMIDNFVNRV